MPTIAKVLAGGVVLAGVAIAAYAQNAAPATKTYTSPAEVQAMIAAKKAGPLAVLGSYLANMEYRTVGGAPAGAVHKTQAELIYIIQGTGTMTVGGSLVNPKDGGGENITGTGITGGTDEALSPGAVVLVPEGTPHAFTVINGPLVDMSIKLPHPPAAQ